MPRHSALRALVLAVALPAAHAQSPRVRSSPAPLVRVPPAMAAIREADLRRDLAAMASDAMRGREAGTPDELRASIWVASMYASLGLEPAGEEGTWYQWFTVTRTRASVAGSRVVIGGRRLELFTDVIAPNVGPIEASGPVLWLADAADTTVDVRGRVVAALLPAPAPGTIRPTSYDDDIRYVDAAVAAMNARFARRGAAAVLLVADPRADSTFGAFAAMRIRGAYDVDRATPRAANGSDRVLPVPSLGSGPPPVLLVRAAMGAALRDAPAAEVSVRLERFEVPSVNVLGRLRGTDPRLREEYVLYSSHQDANGVRYVTKGDSVWAGADDNASVSVAEFAAARAFARQRPRRSLLFVHHGAEERGLLGSRWHSAHPVVPLDRVVAVLNGDMIGRNHPDTAALLGVTPPHRNSRDLVAHALAANAAVGRFVLDTLWDRPTHPEGWYFRSDHLPYARLGVPALMYSTNLHADYHTTRDTPANIDYPKLLRMARWMYLTGWSVANAPARPARDADARLER